MNDKKHLLKIRQLSEKTGVTEIVKWGHPIIAKSSGKLKTELYIKKGKIA